MPDDTKKLTEMLRSFMQASLVKRLVKCSTTAGTSPDAFLNELILRIGNRGVAAVAANPRAPGGDKRAVEYAVSENAYAVVRKVIVDADTSAGHVLQQLVVTHCKP